MVFSQESECSRTEIRLLQRVMVLSIVICSVGHEQQETARDKSNGEQAEQALCVIMRETSTILERLLSELLHALRHHRALLKNGMEWRMSTISGLPIGGVL